MEDDAATAAARGECTIIVTDSGEAPRCTPCEGGDVETARTARLPLAPAAEFFLSRLPLPSGPISATALSEPPKEREWWCPRFCRPTSAMNAAMLMGVRSGWWYDRISRSTPIGSADTRNSSKMAKKKAGIANSVGHSRAFSVKWLAATKATPAAHVDTDATAKKCSSETFQHVPTESASAVR